MEKAAQRGHRGYGISNALEREPDVSFDLVVRFCLGQMADVYR